MNPRKGPTNLKIFKKEYHVWGMGNNDFLKVHASLIFWRQTYFSDIFLKFQWSSKVRDFGGKGYSNYMQPLRLLAHLLCQVTIRTLLWSSNTPDLTPEESQNLTTFPRVW
jgi:hypothetical protein